MTEIDNRLTKIDINLLVKHCGLPYEYITDEEIERCLKQKIFLSTNCIYNGSEDDFSDKGHRAFDIIKIATIVNEIQNGTYNYNYSIDVWADGEDDEPIYYHTDCDESYQIRAFYYCKKDIYMNVYRTY